MPIEPMSEIDPHWLERVKVLGVAQARYLWLLLILMLFYAALHLQTVSSPDKASAKVPIVDLDVSITLVLSSGTGMLSLIILAIGGSRRALRRAREQGLAGRTGEEFDLHPNLIDLAFYAPPGSAAVFVRLAQAVYAIFLSLALVEGVWLCRHMVDARLPATYIAVIVALGILLWFRAFWLVVEMWWRGVRYYSTVWRK
jgi:hypothetical protein